MANATAPMVKVKSLKTIKAPIQEEMKTFEQFFKDSMRSKTPLVDIVMNYIVRRKGKQMRPMFMLLTAKVCGEEVNEATYIGATMIELLHTATLVHDDVVDDSYERRGALSVNALWKNKLSVLIGDYLLSRGLLVSLKNKKYHFLEIMSEAVEAVIEAELLQMEKARRLDIKEDIYYEIITGKTASLIASACAVGAASVTDDEASIKVMHDFGETVGIAFQIRDDLMDYGTSDIGKPTGIDIKEKKMTLPLIYALNQATRSDRKRIINLVKNNNAEPEKVRAVIDFVNQSGGIEYTQKAMYSYRDKAIQLLDFFPYSDAKESMIDLVNFVTERKK